MNTFLFDEIIFGPVYSRRLGISLGVNLLPENSKLCTFNCIYCECGWTPDKNENKAKLHTREEVYRALEEKLVDMKYRDDPLNVITFAGNGEPTIHPDFPGIIDDALSLKNDYFPDAGIAVLSNASLIHKDTVFHALKKIDYNILKLDTRIEDTFQAMNSPRTGISLDKITKYLTRFNGDLIIQSLFIKGEYNGKKINNTTKEELEAWLEQIKKINPKQVMVYTYARNTPASGLEKISVDELNKIAKKVKKLGIDVQVSA